LKSASKEKHNVAYYEHAVAQRERHVKDIRADRDE